MNFFHKYPFNKKAFFIAFLITGILTLVSLATAFGKDEGTLGNGILLSFFADLFWVFRFPTHTLFWPLITSNLTLFIPGLFINITLFALLFERLFTIAFKRDPNKEEPVLRR